MTEKEIIYYQGENGKEPFKEWVNDLDTVIRTRIYKRIDRVSMGNYGDHKSVGSGVFELRYHFGAGYRVYFAEDGDTLVVLLVGGDKSTQSDDIETAQKYLEDYLDDKKEDTL